MAVLLTSPQQALAQPPAGGSAAGDFGSCLSGQHTGDLLVLLDESSSLVANDPDDARVTAARYLLTGLQGSLARSGVSLDVAVAGFSADYRPAVDWTPLTAETLPGLDSEVAAFAQRDDGDETDYWSALEGARRALADRPPAPAGSGAKRCQAVVWLTDGELDIVAHPSSAPRKAYAPDIDPSGEAEVEARANQELCRPGGLTTQLRDAGVLLFGIGLSRDSAEPGRFDLMKAIATGQQPGCAPSTGQPGAFFPAADVDGLLGAIDAILPNPQPPSRKPLCPGLPCEERHVVVLDSSVTAVHILGQVDIPDAQAQLQLPSGETLDLADRAPGPHALDRDGLTIRYTWLSPRTVSIDLAAEPGAAAWPGVWGLSFANPSAAAVGTSSASIRISSDLQPAWVDRPQALRAGDRVPLTLGIADGRQRPVDPATILGELAVSAVFVDPDGREVSLATGVDKTRLATGATLDLGAVRPGSARLRLQLDLTTVAARQRDGTVVPGTRIAPRVVDLPLTIGPKLGYPAVPPRVTFPPTETTTAETTLAVDPPGCVWVEPGQTTVGAAPSGAGAISVVATEATGQDNCRSGPLTLRLDAAAAANGAVTGEVVVKARPDDPASPPVDVAVEFSADLRKPVDGARFWLVFSAVAALGLAVPLLLMTLAKMWTARIPGSTIYAVRVGAQVRDGAVVLDDDPMRSDDDPKVPEPRRAQTYPGGGTEVTALGVQLRRRIGLPFVPATIRATVPGTQYVCASSRPPESDRALAAVLPLVVHGCWLVLHDPLGPPDRAEVLLLFRGDLPLRGQESVVRDMHSRLPQVLGRLRSRADRRAGSTPPAAGPGPEPGRGPGPGDPPPDQTLSTNTFSGRRG
jgi:hypothetical protein